MCQNCYKIVLTEMDIRDTDLPNLPYTVVKVQCVVPGCDHGFKARDYGIAPYYYWPVKILYKKNESWKGGWFDASNHPIVCNRHWKNYDEIVTGPISCDYLLSRVIPFVLKSKKKKRVF